MSLQRRVLIPLAAFILAAAALAPRAFSDQGSPLARQVQARLDAAARVYPLAKARHDAGQVDLDTVYRWSVRWFEAERAVGGDIPAAKAHLARMKALESAVAAQVKAGMASPQDAHAAAYFTAEAEVWALQPPR